MDRATNPKVACVDDYRWYSPYLLKSLSCLCPNLQSVIYVPKSYKFSSSSSIESGEQSDFNITRTWSTYTYPFDIFRKAKSDKVNMVHIQWEFNIFGNFYSTLLLPLLLLFLRLSNVKRVTTIHSVIPRFSFRLKLPGFSLPRPISIFAELFFIMFYRMVMFLSDALIVHGESAKRCLCLDYKAKAEKVFVIPCGVALKAYSLQPYSRFHATLPAGKEIILALGAVSPRKGLDTLIRAFDRLSSKYPSWNLIIAGHVPPYYEYYYRYLKELASDLIKEKRVMFLGEFDLSDTDELEEKSKVVVFPYIYNFGASSTLTFALQHRKVIVISAVNFAKDLLTDGVNALLVPPENPSLLAISIERAMTDESLRENLKEGVDDLLQQISWDSAANKTLKVYQRVLCRPEAKINCDLEN